MKTDEKQSETTSGKKTIENTGEKNIDKKKVKNDSGLKRSLRKVGYWFLFFLLGALIVGLVFYLPANSKLNEAQTELERLTGIESDYENLIVNFERADSERKIYKILANASQMHIALVSNNTDRLDQYVSYIEEDLSDLSIPNFPELPGNLQDQFMQVNNKIPGDRTGALEELQIFQNDLLLLIDNLK